MPWVLGAPTLGRTGELWQEKSPYQREQKPTLRSFSADLTGQQERIISACHPEPGHQGWHFDGWSFTRRVSVIWKRSVNNESFFPFLFLVMTTGSPYFLSLLCKCPCVRVRVSVCVCRTLWGWQKVSSFALWFIEAGVIWRLIAVTVETRVCLILKCIRRGKG